MKNLISYAILLVSFEVLALDPKVNCEKQAQGNRTSIHYYRPGTKVLSPESRVRLMKLSSILARYQHLSENGTTNIARIYRAILPQISEAVDEAEALLSAKDLNQNQVYKLVHSFTRIVDFPVEFSGIVAHYADGVNGLNSYSDKGFSHIAQVFTERHGTDPMKSFLKNFAKDYVEDWKPSQNLSSRYMVDGMYKEQPERQNYFFQYKYVLAPDGTSPLRTLFQDRERGIAYYGASIKPFSPADGQHHGTRLFLNHDLFHAFFMKVKDLALFRSLEIEAIADIRLVKSINNALLQRRIDEWDELEQSDPKLHAGIEAMFYALLHEQAETYPQGVKAELTNSKRVEFYVNAAANEIKKGNLGERLLTVMKGREKSILKRAIEWLAPRVIADNKSFQERFNDSRNSRR